MAVYTNDLRLKEIATGDESGTWGTSTNTNLSLVAEAFSFGTEAITTNADTHTTTIADGSTDPGRSLFLKYTGTLDSACTITIGPNTVSKLWLIENATSGSQNIIIKQGSGATVTVPNGQTKAIYSDGAGSGGAMVDAFAHLNVVDLTVEDDLTITDDLSVGGTLGVTGVVTANAGVVVDNITIDGTEIDLSSGDLTIDVAGDINLDADGGDVNLQDGGTTYAHLSKSSNDFLITNPISDGDLTLRGNDGGSFIAALTLDMSAAGAATFNGTVAVGDSLFLNDGSTTRGKIELNSSDTDDIDIIAVSLGSNLKFHTVGTEVGRFDASGNFGIGGSPTTPLTVTKDAAGIATFTGISSGGVSSLLMKQSRGSIASPSNSATAGDGNYMLSQVYNSGYATIGSIGIITGSALNNGVIQFNTASSGTVAERMLLEADGNLRVTDTIDNLTGTLTLNGRNTGQILLQSGGSTKVTMLSDGTLSTVGGAIFNEGGLDKDFRVESDNSTHAFFIDGTNGGVGFGTSLNSDLHVSATNILLGRAGSLFAERSSSLGIPVTSIGYNFYIDSDTGSHAARITDGGSNLSMGDGTFSFNTAASVSAGAAITYISRMNIGTTSVVINETGVDNDFRVESDGNAHAIFLNAANNGLNFFGASGTSTVDIVTGNGSAGDSVAGVSIKASDANTTEKLNMGVNSSVTNAFIQAVKPGTANIPLLLNPNGGAVVVNETGNGAGDFRVESDTNTHMVFVDAGNNKVFVAKSSDNDNTAGHTLHSTGLVVHTRASSHVAIFNRTSDDGAVLQVKKDGSLVGSIGTRSSGGNLQIHTNQSGIDFGGDGYLPMRGSQIVDNDVDVGSGTFRYDDIFASNGTIQTSDRNEKQDIEALSEAEQRVAVAAKGLLRKFRWKSSVEEKGDDARIHFGIIAQDLQDAFTAEGLDAARYAMFCSDTWTNEDGSEQTRLGVRYSELLAFIISAI